MRIPAELTAAELAYLLGIPKRRIVRRLQSGAIPGIRPSGNPRGKWAIPLQAVQTLYPLAWESVLLRLQMGELDAA